MIRLLELYSKNSSDGKEVGVSAKNLGAAAHIIVDFQIHQRVYPSEPVHLEHNQEVIVIAKHDQSGQKPVSASVRGTSDKIDALILDLDAPLDRGL